MFLSQNSVPSDGNQTKVCPNCVLATSRFHLIEIFPKVFKIVFQPKINCTWSKLFQNISELIQCPSSIASYRIKSETFPTCVLAKIQLHFIENILSISKLCPGRNSIALYRKNFKTTPKCVSAEIELHLIDNFLRIF